MHSSPIGRLLWMAVHNTVFRRTAMTDLGAALSEAAVLLTDREMAELRTFWETIAPLADRPAVEAIQRHARLHYMPLVEEETEPLARPPVAALNYVVSPAPLVDAQTLTILKSAHADGDKETFQRIVAAHPSLRLPREMASYAMLEVRNGQGGKLGWREVTACAHVPDARARITVEPDGLYRVISIKRSAFLRRTGAGLDFYPLPARKLILERWAGEPTVERPDADWLRVGFPPDFARRRGMVYETLVAEQGCLESADDAEEYLRTNGQPGTYRTITVRKIYRRRTSRTGKVTISSHFCLVPDDGNYPEMEPRVLFPDAFGTRYSRQ